jgi:hypothetical protein
VLLQVSTHNLEFRSAYEGKGQESVQLPEVGSPNALVHTETHLLWEDIVCLKYPLGQVLMQICNPSNYQPVRQLFVQVGSEVEFYIWK